MPLTSIIILSLTVILTNAYYLNYHDSVGIPAATRIKERERRAILGEPDFGINTRVLHGTEASIGAYPWLAGLVINLVGPDNESVCGASLVSQNLLTTAGHCWIDKELKAFSFEVVLGSQYIFHGGLRIVTKNVTTHPKWGANNTYFEYDVAVIYLPQDVTFDEYIYPINLPYAYIKKSFAGHLTIGAGYGALNEEQGITGIFRNATIHQVVLTVITNAECQSYFRSTSIKPCFICTSGLNGVGICQGDSGGPLITYIDNVPILIGITSRTSVEGCGVGKPSLFTRVTEVLDFINEHLQEHARNTTVNTVVET